MKEPITFTSKEIKEFLCTVDKMFPVPLSQKVDLSTYAEKLLVMQPCAVLRKMITLLQWLLGILEIRRIHLDILRLLAFYRSTGEEGMPRSLYSNLWSNVKKQA